MKKLFLDDIRIPKDALGLVPSNMNQMYWNDDWDLVTNYSEFCNHIQKNGLPEFISFDHDISSYDVNEKELTGKDAADFLINYCMDNGKQLPDWFVHSDNTGGNKNIRQLFTNYMYRVEGRLDKMVDAYGYVNGNLIYNI